MAVYHVRGNQEPHQGKHWLPVLLGIATATVLTPARASDLSEIKDTQKKIPQRVRCLFDLIKEHKTELDLLGVMLIQRLLG